MMEHTGGANLDLALHYLELGRPEQSLSALQRADEDQLENPFYWYLRGQALYDQALFEEAAESTRKGLALAPEAVYLLYLLCNIEAEQKNLVAAEEAILKALHQKPDDPQLLCRYAILIAQGGQLDKAERLLVRARQTDPEHPAAIRTEMILSYLRGSDKEVVRSGEAALSSDPEDAYMHYLVGQALAEQGHVKETERFLSGAARLEPGDRELTDAALNARFLAHWLMIPLRPVERFGPGTVWLAAVGIMVALFLWGFKRPAFIFSIFYIIFAAYTWVVPPLLRRWMKRKYRRFK